MGEGVVACIGDIRMQNMTFLELTSHHIQHIAIYLNRVPKSDVKTTGTKKCPHSKVPLT